MAELGTYYITIMPDMSQFTGEVNRALSKAGADSGKGFNTSFIDIVKGSAIGTAIGGIAQKAGQALADGMDVGIRRLDTLQNFPKVMESLGYSAEDAGKSIETIMKHLDGLPSSTQDLVTLTQAISDSTGDLDLATAAALGFNDMMLANGASAQEMANAQGVLNRVLGKGSATAAQWQSLTAVMPAQLGMVARSMLGAEASTEDLHAALEDGTVSWNDFLQAIADLDKNGYIDETGKQLASFEEQARANSHGIGTAIDNIRNRIGAGWANIFDAVGQEAISSAIDTMSYGIKNAMTRIADAIKYLKEKIGQTKIGENLAKIGESIGKAFKSISDVAADKLRPLADAMVELIDKGLQWVADHGDLVASMLAAIGGALAFKGALNAVTTITGVAKGLDTLGSALAMTSKLSELPTAFSLAAEAGGPLSGVFSGLGSVIGFVAANPMVLIGAAIAAVAAGLVYFFTQTEKGREIWAKFKQGMVDFAKGAAKAVTTAIKGLVSDFKKMVERIKQNLADNKVQWNLFKQNVTNAMTTIKTFVINAWNNIKTTVTNVVKSIKDTVTNTWNAIKTTVTTVINTIKTTVSAAWDAIKNTAISKWNAVKAAIAAAWTAIKTTVTTTINAIKTLVSTAWDAVKTTAVSKWEAVKSAITTAWNGIKTAVTTKVNELKTSISTAWDNIKSTATSKFDAIKSAASTAWEGIKSTVTGKIDAMKQAITSFKPSFPSIAAPVIGSITSVIDGMRKLITGFKPSFPSIAAPIIGSISSALETIRRAVEGFLPKFPTITWPQPTMPHIPLPHFTVTWDEILGGVLKIPHVTFNGWWAKGGVFDTASIIGIGEAGPEAALPLNRHTYGEIARGIAREGAGSVVVTGNTFIVREEADIDRVAERIAAKIRRERWAAA